jgi:hypothetical protein
VDDLEWIDPECWIKLTTTTPSLADVKLMLALAGFTFQVIEET